MAVHAEVGTSGHPIGLNDPGAGRPGVVGCWLFRRIVKLGWHPLLRINQGAEFRPAG